MSTKEQKLTVYADESSDGNQERIFAMGSLIGTQGEWELVEQAWSSRTGGIVFHATDCVASRGDFRNNSPEVNQALYKDLTKILAESSLYGFGIAIDIQLYKEMFPHTLPIQPYLECFINIVDHMSQLGSRYLPSGQKVKFIFDRRQETKHIFALYKFICESKTVGLPSVMSDQPSTATSETVGIQVADLFSREVMKDFEWFLGRNRGKITHRRRTSWEILNGTGRFEFMYCLKENSENLQELMLKIKQENDRWWSAYEEWLSQKGCIDNAENRTRHLFHAAEKHRC